MCKYRENEQVNGVPSFICVLKTACDNNFSKLNGRCAERGRDRGGGGEKACTHERK